MIRLRFSPYPLKLRHTFTVATCSRTMTPDILVALECDGLIGYGEASTPPYLGESMESVVRFLQQVDLSSFSSSSSIEEIMDYVDHVASGNHAAKAAIDIALHDLEGKKQAMPLYSMWGLNSSETPLTTYTIGIDRPEVMIDKVKEIEGQFGRLKIKVGTESDDVSIAAIRSVSDLPLTVDANQGWTSREEALDKIIRFKEQGVIMVEQPLPKDHLVDLAWLTERSPLPIIADESLQRLADVECLRGVVHGINIKLMKCTGLFEARKMIAAAKSYGMQVMLGCMTETSCAVTAAAHLSPFADFADLDGNLLIANNPFTGGVSIEKGRLRLPNNPVIGVTPANEYVSQIEIFKNL